VLDPIIAPAQAFSLPEDAAIGTVIGTVAVTGDADGLSFSITGGNAGNLFAIDAATGVITLAAALDRETAASHSLTIAVDDEDGGSTADSSATVTITVTDVNDRAPVVTPGQSLSVAENSAAGTSLGSAAATDADASFTASAWSITGGSGQGLFDIDATTGAITVASGASLNFEAASSYTLTLTVLDGVNTAAPASIAISVTDVNEAPTDITLGATSIAASATSAGAAVGSLGVTDPDAGGSCTFSLVSGSGDADNASFQINGSTLQTSGALAAGVYSVRIRATDQGGLSHERSFTISAGPDAPGVPDLAAGSDNGSSATDNLTHATSLVFTGTGTAGADLLLFQDGNANGALDAGEASASTTIDGNGDWSATLDASALGDGAHAIRAIQIVSGLDSAASTALSVTIDRGAPALPSAPGLALASNSGSTADSLTNVTTPTPTGTAEAHALVTLLVDGVSIGTTTADGSGAWSFTPGTALAGGSRSITATATDAAGNTSAASGALALTLDATAPAWTTGGTASLAEGTTAVASLAASDGQAVTFAILGGADQARFSLSGATLAFATAPDFEAPADADTDNSHVVTLRATDAAGNTADLTLTVTVTNQNEAPATPSDADAGAESVAEGATTGTSVGLTATATDPDAGASLTYSLTDNAGGRFAIDTTTGIVTVADGTLLDFEAAASHAITVQVSDGSLTATRSFAIAVANVNETPVLSGSLGASWVETAGLAGSTGFAGASLTVGFASYVAGDLITLPASQGALSYDSTTGAVEVGGVQIGTASGGFGSALVVSFNGAATAAAIDTVLANILYNSYGGDDPTDGGSAPTRAITASFADGGNSGSGGSLTSASLTGTLIITATNDAEAFTGSLTTTPYVEGGTALALLGTATIGRIDAASLQGGSLTIGFGAYQPSDRLGIAEGGGITLAGGTLSHGGQVIGTVSGGVEADLVISFTTADASQAAVQALAGQLVFSSLSDDPTAGGTAASRTVTLTLSDGGATGGTAATTQVTGSLALTAVNDAPSLATNAGATTETGGQVTFTPAMLAASDPDDGPAGLSFTLTTAPTAGTLYRDSNDNGLLDGGEALAAGDSVTQMEINLGRVIYRHGGGPGTSEGFTLALADGGEDGAQPVTGQSFVLSVAMRPVVTIGGGSPAHAEDGAATAIAPNLSLADDDSANLAGATVTVTDLVAGDLLGFTDQAGIAGSFDAATGVLTLTGTASRTAYEAALRSVTYRSSDDNPATGAGNADRVIEFRVTDGTLQSLAGIGQTVAVTNANDAPSLDATQLPMLSGIAEDAAAPLAGSTAGSTLVASLLGGAADADTGALQGLAITGVSALGSLHYSTDGGASWTQVTATLSNANALLLAADARIAFVTEAERNGSIAEAITFRAWDRSTGSNGALAAITATGGGTAFSADADSAGILVAAMNDAPGFTAGASLAAVEEDTAQPPGASIASLFADRFSDAVDAVSGGSAANALSGIAIAADASTPQEGAWQYSTDAGAHWHAVGAVSGGAALLLDASALLRFLPAANHNGAVGGLTVHAVEDSAATSFTSGAARQTLDLAAGGGTSAVSAAGVALATSITALNDAPVAVADAGAATEAGGSTNASPGSPASGNVLTNDTDIDAGATLAVSAVQHGATAGTLGQALAGAHGTLTLAADGSYSYAVDEADAAVQALAAGQSLTDSFSYAVSDGSLGATGLLTITIAGANDAPVLAGGGSAQAVQRDQPVPLGASVTVTDPDNAGFAGGTLTVGITAGGAGQDGLAGAQDLLGLGHAGTGAGEIGVSGHAVSYGGQAIGTWSGGAGAPLVIALNGNADASAVAALVAALTYANASAGGALVVTDRTVTLTFTDGSGGTSNAVTTTMAVNRPPVLAVNTGVAGAEGAVVTITAAQLAAEDPDGSTAAELVFTLTTAPAQGSLFLDANGNAALDAGEALAQGDSFTQADIAAGRLAYRQDGSESTADGFGLGLTDRDGVGTGGLSVALTIAPVNDAPGLTDGATQALAGTDEDTAGAGSLVSTLLAGAGLTDADAGALGGMAVVAAQGSGSWQYSVDGLAWTDFGPASAEAALLLTAGTQLRYLPDAANGETASLGFRAWDRTSGTASAQGAPSTADTTAQGGSTAFSTGLAGATLAVAAANDVPVPGGGLAGQPATDAAGLAPFAGFTIADVDSGQPLSIAITLRDAGGAATDANGGFTEASLAAAGFTRTGTGLYAGSFAGAAEAEAALRALVFAPMPNQLDPGASVTTRFAIAVTDAVENGQGGATATDDTTTVDVTSANDAPVLGGGSPDQAITDGQILLPFASITLADADATQDQAISVTLRDADGNATDANGGFTEASLAAAGFSKTGTGLYAGSFTSAAVAEAALRQLVFAPTPDQLLPGTSGTTRFAVTVTDAALNGQGGASAAQPASLTVASVNDAPVALLPLIPAQSYRTDAGYSLALPMAGFADADARGGDRLAFSLSGPPGLTLAASGGVLTIAAGASAVAAGSHAVTLTATDLSGATAQVSFVLEVGSAPPPPLPAPPPPAAPPPAPPPVAPSGVPAPILAAVAQRGSESVGPAAAPPPLPSFAPAFALTPSPITALVPGSRGAEAPGAAPSGGLVSFGREGGFLAGSGALRSIGEIGARQVAPGRETTIQLPAGSFRHSDPRASVAVEARLADGRPLPSWARFDPATGSIQLSPPPGLQGTLSVQVIARDGAGNEASIRVEITVGEGAPAAGPADAPAPPPERGAALPAWLDPAPLAEAEAAAPDPDAAPPGKPGLSEQLRQAGAEGRLDALLRALGELADPDDVA
jgi:VCBS repeat-containing protein